MPPRLRSSFSRSRRRRIASFFGQAVHRAGLVHLDELAQTQQAALDGGEVGEHAAEPAVVDVGHVHAGGLLGHDLLGLLLRADEQHDAATAAEALDERVGFLEAREGLFEVDQVDPGTLPEQVRLHLRVPPARLVAEVHACFEKLPPGDDRHGSCSFRLFLRPDRLGAGPQGTPANDPRTCELGAGAPAQRVYQRVSAAGFGSGFAPGPASGDARAPAGPPADRTPRGRPRGTGRQAWTA